MLLLMANQLSAVIGAITEPKFYTKIKQANRQKSELQKN